MARRQQRNTCLNVMVYFGIFVALGLLTFVLLIPKKPESFFVSSKDILRNNTDRDFENIFKASRTTMEDKDELLLMNGCYQFPTTSNEYHDCYEVSFAMQTDNFTNVVTRIQNEVIAFKDRIGKPVKSPVYVMIAQAPFMRDEKGNVITVQYNSGSYIQEPVNYMKNSSDKQPIFFTVTLYFTMYYKNMIQRTYQYDIKTVLSRYSTRKQQCFMSCYNDSNNNYCGCINTTTPYVSKCSATPANGDVSKAEPANFRALYIINHLNPFLAQSNALVS